MRVILLKDVKGVGRMHEEKAVSEGYGVNFLIPKKLAIPATGSSAAQIKNLKQNNELHKEAEFKKLEAEVHKLTGKTIKLSAKVNEKGHLFSALDAKKISDLLKKEGVDIPNDLILLEEKIKEAGTHSIPVKIGSKVTHFTLEIKAE